MSTPYRNDADALHQRKESLENELRELRADAARLEGLRAQETEVARELAEVDARIGGSAAKRALPLLDRVKVAAPCNVSWDSMTGNGRVRFCGDCKKNVFNLSAMTREDAEALLRENAGGELCVRYYQRADGTILTEDCPVGVKKRRRRRVAVAVAGIGFTAFGASQLASRTCVTSQRMGAVAVMGEMAPDPAPPIEPTPGPSAAPVPAPVMTAPRAR